MVRKKRMFAATVVPALAVLTLAACGSSSDSSTDSASTGAASTPAASTGAASTTAATNDTVAKAQETTAALMKRPTTMKIPALPAKPATGKTVDFIACAAPTCQAFVKPLQDAVDAAGWKLKVVQGGFEPQQIQTAWNTVVRDKPDGVIASGGIPTTLFNNQLKQLQAAGTPVVLHDQVDEGNPAVTNVVMSDKENAQFGQELADLILADSGGKDVHLGIFAAPEIPVFANERKALNDTIKSSACENCTVDTFEFPTSAAGTKLPSQVVSFLRSHPDTNYLYFDYNDAVDGVPAALQRAGLADKVKILINSIGTTEAAYMRNGQIWAAAANPWPEVMWTDFHDVLAKDAGAPAETSAVELPNMIVTKDNLPAFDGALFPLVENYQDLFKQAWKVQ